MASGPGFVDGPASSRKSTTPAPFPSRVRPTALADCGFLRLFLSCGVASWGLDSQQMLPYVGIACVSLSTFCGADDSDAGTSALTPGSPRNAGLQRRIRLILSDDQIKFFSPSTQSRPLGGTILCSVIVRPAPHRIGHHRTASHTMQDGNPVRALCPLTVGCLSQNLHKLAKSLQVQLRFLSWSWTRLQTRGQKFVVLPYPLPLAIGRYSLD